jgi:hypothetical protein
MKKRINNFSIFFILLPYILLNFQITKNSYLFDFKLFGGVILLIVFIDWLIGIFCKKNYPSFLGCILLTVILLFFYGAYIIVPVQKMITLYFQHYIRGRIMFVAVYFIMLLLLFLVTQKKLTAFLHFNIFSLIFSFSIICNFILFPGKEVKTINTAKNISGVLGTFDSLADSKFENKPILLIITDAYASPKEIEKKFSIFEANKLYYYLEKNHWQLKYKFYSEEVNTGRSMASMFNYNLSAPENNYSSLSPVEVSRYLINPTLIADLNTQKIEFVNKSFFEISKKKPFFTIGDLPNSFTELFLLNSIYFLIKASTTGAVNLEDFTNGYSSVYQYNQKIIDELTIRLRSPNNSNNKMEYYHLLMPHTPYNFGGEFTSTDLKTKTYFRYWNFTNNKLINILKNVQPDKYRIIITGDHGHGGEKGKISFDIHYTFAAFYGFEKVDVDRINSVQNIGLLINKYLIETKK